MAQLGEFDEIALNYLRQFLEESQQTLDSDQLSADARMGEALFDKLDFATQSQLFANGLDEDTYADKEQTFEDTARTAHGRAGYRWSPDDIIKAHEEGKGPGNRGNGSRGGGFRR